MNIENSKEASRIPLHRLVAGVCFEYEFEFYILQLGSFKAINLKTGYCVLFSPDVLVIPYPDSKVVLK